MFRIKRTSRAILAVSLSIGAVFMLIHVINDEYVLYGLQIYKNKPYSFEDKSFEAVSSTAEFISKQPDTGIESRVTNAVGSIKQNVIDDSGSKPDWWNQRLARKESLLGRKMDYSENCHKKLPHAIIFGVMKCGTEALSSFLAIHPDIETQMKVPATAFFKTGYDKGLEWYRSQMPCSSEGQITLEKSPQYFAAPFAPQRIHDMNSSIRLIMIIREPVARAISQYTHVMSLKPDLYPQSFEETITGPDGKINFNHEIFFKSMYVIYLKRWLEYFSLDQIHVVNGNDFKENPAEELQKIEKFLGLRNYITPDHFEYQPEKGFFCISATDEEDHCMGRGKGREHPSVNMSVVNELRAFFKPYNKELFKIINRTFHWGY